MINSIKNGDQPLPHVTQVSIAGTTSTEQPPLKDKSMCRYLQVINDLKKCDYSKDNCELNFKFLNNLQPKWKQYATMMRHNKNLMDINIDALYNILKQNQGDVNDAMGSKKKTVVVTSDPLALIAEKTNVSRSREKVVVSSDSEGSKVDDFSELRKRVKYYNCKKEGHFAKVCKKAKVKDYEYYKTKMLLAKKDKDKQVLLAEDQAWMESSKASSSSVDEKISEVSYYLLESKSESEFKTSEYYDNSTKYGLFVNNDDDQEIFHDAIDFASENFIENHIDSQKDYDKSDVDHNDSEKKDQLVDKLIRKFNKKIVKCQNRVEKANQQSEDFKNQNKDLQDKYDVLKNQKTTFEMNNKELNEQLKELIEKNNDLLAQTKVIGLGYTSMFLTYSDEALEIENFKSSRENKIKFAYDYGNLNASYVNEKINFEDNYFQDIINPDFEKIDSLFQQTSSLKPYVPNVILEKIIIDLEDEVVNLLEKEKVNLETIESLKSKGVESSETISPESENQSENDCHVVEKQCGNMESSKVIAPGMFKLNVSQCVSPISTSKSSYLDTFSSVRRPKNSGVIWKKKGSSNVSYVGLSAVSVSNLNKNVKRYSRKDLLACTNFHLGETSSDYMCNDAMNVSCDSRMNDFLDDNNLFIFDDVNVRISPVSKMPLRKKPRDSMHIVQICLWIIDSGSSKHMAGNRALLMNFVEKFLGTVRFGSNDFAVIDGYGNVVIGSMTIMKVYYVEGLGHNLFDVGQFCDKGLEFAFRKFTCFVRNEDGVYFLTDDRSSNLYSIALNEVASNSSTCLLAKASSSQSWLWHQRLSHLNFATINNLVKNNLVQCLPKMKFEKDHLCSAYEQGKIHQKHHKSKTAFALNKPLYLLHMDLCGPMRVQIQRVRTDNGTEFKNKTLAKFFDE
nr:integrase, catalytic region, zinc finger, CCHC-type, peptidase aspartic, catalytic [Tanacetum cinerariifolium]